jgi:hypothetical protein
MDRGTYHRSRGLFGCLVLVRMAGKKPLPVTCGPDGLRRVRQGSICALLDTPKNFDVFFRNDTTVTRGVIAVPTLKRSYSGSMEARTTLI